MEDTKGYDLLMVENEDGLYLVEAPAFKASVDGLVLFDGGKIGRIVKRAQWCLHSRLKPTLQAEKLFDLAWADTGSGEAGK